MSDRRYILGSGSPRRAELLQAAGYQFEIIVPNPDAEKCGVCTETGPAALVLDLAMRKAADVAPRAGTGILIAADTVAECQGQILGKPAHAEHAADMLRTLAGKEHRVYTGICVWNLPHHQPEVRVITTVLRMDDLTDQQIDEYIESGLWEGKAGAFGFQDGLDWVHIVQGSESNVVGLPMEALEEMLAGLNDE